MKKNPVGHILYHKEPIKRRISAWHLLARFLCLLLALLLWLILVNADEIVKWGAALDGVITEQSL